MAVGASVGALLTADIAGVGLSARDRTRAPVVRQVEIR
jgi:hypothetical protein